MGTVDVQHTEELTIGLEPDNAVASAASPNTIAPLFTNPADWFVPSFPEKLEDLDVNPGFLADLALKIVPLDVDCTRSEERRVGKEC